MKTLPQRIALFAATCLAFSGASIAQTITVSTETITPWNGDVANFGGSQHTLGQTFTNLTSIYTLTYTFMSASAAPTGGTLSYKFGEWQGGSFSTGFTEVLGSGSVTIGAADFAVNEPLERFGSDYYYATRVFDANTAGFDITSLVLDPSKTYAFLFNVAGNPGFGLGWLAGDPFTYGSAYNSSGAFGPAVDYAFSYMSVEAALPPAPIPESSTVAAIIVVVFVAGLVGFRLRQRRQLVPVPVSIAA